jgi:endo-1,4-beta-xylanase
MRALISLLIVAVVGTSVLVAAPIQPNAPGVPAPSTAPSAASDRRTPAPPPPDKQIQRPSRDKDAWQIPPKDVPEKMRLVGFESHILNQRVSYLVYLPPGYDLNPKVRFPVIYMLPGVSGDCREVGILAQRLDTMINRKQCIPIIVVAVQGVYGSYYTDAWDKGRPIESVIVKELIDRVDATFRTIPSREARALEGLFMGGYGAAFLGFKYPDTFGVISMFSPPVAPLKWFQQEAPMISRDVWSDDQSYFDANDPYLLVAQNADKIRGRTKIRIYVGENDPYRVFTDDLHARLTALNIDHQYEVVPGVGQNGPALLKALKGNIYPWWSKAFPIDMMFTPDHPTSAPTTQPGG